MRQITFKGLTIAAALVLSSATAFAQTNGWLGAGTSYSQDTYRAPYENARRGAYDNGYRDGLRRGEQAARDGRQFNVERERDYRDAENGYNRSYGDRARYRDDYRGGFAQGYRDGYNRRGNTRGDYGYGGGYGGGYGDYPRNGDYRDGGVYRGNGSYRGGAGYGAFQNGIADGYRKGLEDIQKRRSADVSRHSWYRSGDHDYDRAYGSRDAYKLEYRRGFQEGYNRTFREARRY